MLLLLIRLWIPRKLIWFCSKGPLNSSKMASKVGKIDFYVVNLANFEKSTRTHQYAHQNKLEMLYGMHRYSRKKNWACWSMVRFWPSGLFSGLMALNFFLNNSSYAYISQLHQLMSFNSVYGVWCRDIKSSKRGLIAPFIIEYSPMCKQWNFC